MSKGRSFIGTSGFTLQNFYLPWLLPSHRLSAYAKVFTTVEINTTFYHLPQKRTIKKWLGSVPSDFVFAFKVFRGITHLNQNRIDKALLKKWFEIYEPFQLNLKNHLMLFQFPESCSVNFDNLLSLLSQLPSNFRYAFEFRHSSWFIPAIYQQLKDHGVALVWSDVPLAKSGLPIWPQYDLEGTDFTYLRFHGSKELYASGYTAKEIENFATLIKKKLQNGQNVFGYFNNDIYGQAASNAQSLWHTLQLK